MTNRLDEVADAATTSGDLGSATFVIVRPGTSRSRVYGSEPTLRAAVSVVVAAGSDRRWVALAHGIHKVSVIDLPAVMRSVAEQRSDWQIRVGVVRPGNDVSAVVLWFGTHGDDAATIDARQHLLGALVDAST